PALSGPEWPRSAGRRRRSVSGGAGSAFSTFQVVRASSGRHKIPREAEAEIVDAEGRVAASTARCSAPSRRVGPAAAAEHPVGAIDLGVVDVPAPLPGVADGVVQAPGVRLPRAHLVDPTARVALVPGDRVERSVPRLRAPRSAGLLPLGLGG